MVEGRGLPVAGLGASVVLLLLVAGGALGASPVQATDATGPVLAAGGGDSLAVATTSSGPVASCTVSSTSVEVDESVTLDASASENVEDYQYDKYGDASWGDYLGQSSITVSYGEAGTYEPRVKVWSYDGGEQSDTATCGTVTVTDPTPTPTATPAPAPTARCTVSSTSVEVGESVTLDASASENVEDYQYDKYGDASWGDYLEESSITVTYGEVGTYEPRVKVWSYDGGERSDTATCGSVTVTESTPTPTVTPTATATPTATPTPTPTGGPTAVCSVGQTDVSVDESVVVDARDSDGAAQFEFAKSSDASYRDPVSDGLTTVRYQQPGTYSPRVRVTDDAGATDTATCGSITVTEAENTPTETETATDTATATLTPVPTATTTGTATPSPTRAPTPTASPTATSVPTSSTTTERPDATESPTSRTETPVPTSGDPGTNGTDTGDGGSGATDGAANGTAAESLTASATTGDPGTRTTTETGPGFGVLAAILAVAIAVVRRRNAR